MKSNDDDAASRPDDESPEWTTEEVKRAHPALDVIGETLGACVAENLRRGRGRPAKADNKVNQTLRLDRDVVEAYRRQGNGWQVRMNEVLREHMPRPPH
jgi:uncharacterized protein (DUF4415 family)